MISYDTNILIYALEGISEWTKPAQKIVQEGERNGAVLSVLAWQELMTGAALRGNNVDDKLKLILNDFIITKFVPVSKNICEKAVTLTKQYGKHIYGYDAIHLATALENRAEVFITNDEFLLKVKIDQLHIQGL